MSCEGGQTRTGAVGPEKKPEELRRTTLARRTTATGAADRSRTASPRRVLMIALLLLSVAVAARAQATETELVDRIVAIVDEDPILRSDMDRAISLGLVRPDEGESEADFERRVLDEIIIDRLRTHEVDRFGARDLPLSEVDAQMDRIRLNFVDEAAFEAALDDLGLSRDDLREILARQLMVFTYVEERLGPRVFVSLDDIQTYYDEVLTVEMRRQGEPVPELAAVREQIRAVVREQRLNRELEAWTEDLYFHADIIDYLEREPRELPPVVE